MRTLFIIISLLAATAAYSQSSPQITVSTEKVKVNGSVLYVHKVKGGETLYSLAKAYNVAIDDIVRQNESLKSGLKEGTTIYIPSSTPAPATGKPEAQPVAENTGTGTSEIKDIIADKDEVRRIDGWQLSGENIKKYSRKKHKAKWYEHVGDLAVKYKVSAEAIMSFNNLETKRLKKKQVVYIPNELFLELLEKSSLPEEVKVPEEEKPATEEVKQEEDVKVQEETSLFGKNSIAYILPLNLRDTLGPNASFMDFYAGALLAADTLKNLGHDLTITLVDQSAGNNAARFDNTTIIGPVKGSDMEKFLPTAGSGNTVISPMDINTGKLVAGNRNFVQIAPSQEDQLANLMDLLATRISLDNSVMIIYERNGADGALVEAAKRMANERGILYNTLSYDILQGREMMDKIKDALEPGLDNLVLIPSNSEAFVSDVVRNLNLLYTNPAQENRRSVMLFGTPRWRNFENIEVDYFHKMNLHLSIPYYVDYNKQLVKDFIMKYRALYNCEPTPFAFQGFDITMMSCGYENYTLQSNYKFKKDNAGDGLRNTGNTNIVYNKDYTISVIE